MGLLNEVINIHTSGDRRCGIVTFSFCNNICFVAIVSCFLILRIAKTSAEIAKAG